MQGLGSLFSCTSLFLLPSLSSCTFHSYPSSPYDTDGNVNGSNYVRANGSNIWKNTVQKPWPQHYLKLSKLMTNTTVANVLDGLYLAKK